MDKAGSSTPFVLLYFVFHVRKVKGVLLKWGHLKCQQGANGVIMGKTMGTVPRDSPVYHLSVLQSFSTQTYSKTAIVMVTEGRPGRRSPVHPLHSKNNA